MKRSTSFSALLYLSIFFFTSTSAQGIHFENGLNWSQVKAKAKREQKFIFLDCYTTWCVPCKKMEKEIYPLAAVGNFFNLHFVSVKVQMDTSKQDTDEIKKWYKNSHDIEQKFKVAEYPTFLFLSPQGEIVHRAVGYYQDPHRFLDIANHAVNKDFQFYTLLKSHEQNKLDVSVVSKLVPAAFEAGQDSVAISLGKIFVANFKGPYTRDTLQMIERLTKRSDDSGFSVLLEHMNDIKFPRGQNSMKFTVMNILLHEIVGPQWNNPHIDWSDLQNKIATKSNSVIAAEIIAKAKTDYYRSKKMWNVYSTSFLEYLNNYGDDVQPYLLNNLLWPIFLHVNDSNILKMYLPWAAKSFEYDSTFFNGMDTYANFLYKLGRKEDALVWEKKALDIAESKKDLDQQKYLVETINKMRQDQKTWE